MLADVTEGAAEGGKSMWMLDADGRSGANDPMGIESPASNRSGTWRRIVAGAVGTTIFLACALHIALTFQWRELWRAIVSADLVVMLIGGGASIIGYWILRTVRWRILLQQADADVPLFDLHMCTAVSLSLALITPVQSGELLKVEWLKKHGLMHRAPGYGVLLVEKVLDLTVLLALAFLSLVFGAGVLSIPAYGYVLLAGLILSGIIVLAVLARLPIDGPLRKLFEHVRPCVENTRVLVLAFVVTVISWASVAFSWQIFLASTGVVLSFGRAIALMSIVSTISIASLIPGGLGVCEVGTTHFLNHYGFGMVPSQVGAIALRAYSLVALVLGGCYLLAWKLARMRQSVGRQGNDGENIETVRGKKRHPSA